MKYVGATNRMVTLPFFVEGLTMGLISGILTAAVSLGCYTYVVNAAGGLGGIWQMLMGRALVPVANVLLNHRGNKPAQRCHRRRRGQYALYPQTSECVDRKEPRFMSKAMHAKPFPAHRPLYRPARPAGKPPQQADPCGQPWAGLCLPAVADSHSVPGLGSYQ